MHFHACTIAVCPHRRVDLYDFHFHLCYPLKTTEDSVTDSSCHPFYEGTRYSHLLRNQLIYLRIVECIAHLVADQRLGNVILDSQIYRIVVAGKPFLRQYAMISMELEIPEQDITMQEFHLPPPF